MDDSENPVFHLTMPLEVDSIRVATYNIHKGVQGLGPLKRLEVHNLILAIEQLDADIVCLQEVRNIHHGGARQFGNWPEQPQAQYLCPEGYTSIYRTNAITPEGEHGNALLTRWPVVDSQHEDISDHFMEQRGILHVVVRIDEKPVHVLVVHLGLVPGSRARQVERIKGYIDSRIPPHEALLVAGDFNEWGDQTRYTFQGNRLKEFLPKKRVLTYPSIFPVVQFDHIYARWLEPTSLYTPRGRIWWRMSDHLPLIGEFRL